MDVPTFPRSAIPKMLADLGIRDPDSVTRIVIDPGHVTVIGYTRDQLDEFASPTGTPAQWSRVFPIDFQA